MAIATSPARTALATWTFEPGHTGAEFRARHMMVAWVRGHIKNVRGTLKFDPLRPAEGSVEVEMDATDLWTGVKQRDDHLKSADFLDVANHPKITFRSTKVEVVGADEFLVHGDLTIRGVTRPVMLEARYQGQWVTPWWEDGVDKGPKSRAGFVATALINRKDFGVNWNDQMDRGGVVVSDYLYLTLDVEAVLDEPAAARKAERTSPE